MTLRPLSLRFHLQELAAQPDIIVTRGDLGAVIKHIEQELTQNGLLQENETPSELRHLIFGFLFGDTEKPIEEISSHALTDGQIYALKRWISAQKIEEAWIPRAEFLPELIEVVKVVKYLRQ